MTRCAARSCFNLYMAEKETVAQQTEAPTEILVPLEELEVVDVSDKKLEQMARGFIMGSQAIGRRKEVREELEKKVIGKIGKKGKYLTDKLFELIEGVYVVDKRGGKNGREVRYYQVPPNLNAIIYALDRVLGKPKQQIEQSQESKGIILVEHVIRNLANNPYKQNGSNGAGKNAGELEGRGTGNGSDARDGGSRAARVNEGAGQIAV